MWDQPKTHSPSTTRRMAPTPSAGLICLYRALVLTALILAGCGDDAPTTLPAAGSAPIHTTVLCAGGLGYSQLSDLQDALNVPGVQVITAGSWDGYQANYSQILAGQPGKRVLIAHSFGCDTAVRQDLPVDLLVLIDPVGRGWQRTLPYPAHASRLLVFHRSRADFEPLADIPGTTPIVIASTSHNSLPASPELISRIQEVMP